MPNEQARPVLAFDVYGTLIDPFRMEDHLRAAIRSAGLTLCALSEGALRTEARIGVQGLVFVASSPSSAGAG